MAEIPSHGLTFTHTRLLVTDYRTSFQFYRDVLGFDVEWGNEDGVYADFRTGATTLALFDRGAMAEAIGTNHTIEDTGQQDVVSLIFEVESVDETYERLENELSFITEPHDQPGWGIRVAHFRDPEGILIEINEPLDRGER